MLRGSPIALLSVMSMYVRPMKVPDGLEYLAKILVARGLMSQRGERWQLTELGRAVVERERATIH